MSTSRSRLSGVPFEGGFETEKGLKTPERSAGVFVPGPQGAFYLFPDFSALGERLAERGVRTSGDLCERLLADTGVALLPGTAFGRSGDELTARVSYVDFDGAQALIAADAVPLAQNLDAAFLERFCGNTIRAADVIVEWVSA
jgi:aspartate aminotransferase